MITYAQEITQGIFSMSKRFCLQPAPYDTNYQVVMEGKVKKMFMKKNGERLKNWTEIHTNGWTAKNG